MTKKQFADVTLKILCVVLAIILLFASAQIVIFNTYEFVHSATAKTAEEKANKNNELTSADDYEILMPNYDSSVITKTNLPKPEVTTYGMHEASYYPSYINQLSDFPNDKKSEIWAENVGIINQTKADYESGMLKDYLKKHNSADGQFYATGNFDDAPRIEKVTTINSLSAARRRSLGVFAPAGEVLTVTIDESMVGKLTVIIGYPYGDGIDDIKNNAEHFKRWKNDRMARFYLEFKLNDTVNYIGSPLGGMVVLSGGSGMGTYSITVSGGIDMPEYKLGVSTKEDWKNILAAPGPYVWLLSPYQYMVMPKDVIKNIEDPYDAMMWWHKASMISLYAIAREDTGNFWTPVISIYDSFVYSGEAVAATWGFYTNNPIYWCEGVLDYDNLMKNGSWGNLHEYNHHNQAHAYPYTFNTDWGVGDGDEMTNNVLNAASYILLTDIAAQRSETNMWGGNWQSVTDPYCNYNRLKASSNSSPNYGKMDAGRLFGYVDLMHSFGVEKFLNFLRAIYGYGEPVEGYTGKNLTQDASLREMDNFTLFMCLYYKIDFTDYLTKVWHFTLSDETMSEIASHNFDKYFSINNLYAVGLKGIETGRPYKINVGTTTVLDFNKYTLCSADNFNLDSVTSPKHGKLVKNSDGTYSYTPNSDFTEDSFELNYSVNFGGKTYTRTLVVKFSPNYKYIESATYNGDQSKGNLTVQEAIAEFEKDENLSKRGTASNFSTATASGYTLTHFKATVVFPFTKEVTFMVYGDDKSMLKIGDKTAFTNAYIGNDNGGVNATDNKITMTVKQGESLKFEAWCYNAGGNGNLRVKYSEDGGTSWKDIPSSYCYGYNVTDKQIKAANSAETKYYPAYVDFRNMYINRYYTGNSVRNLAATIECVDDEGEPVKLVDGADLNAIIDGDTSMSSSCHTAWRGSVAQGTITPYPHNYYITFEKATAFNNIRFSFKDDAFGEYEIYTSEDGVEYTLLAEGENTRTGSISFDVLFEKSVETQYIKLVVKSQVQNKAFYNFREMEFLQTLDLGLDYNAYSSSSKALIYDNNWQSVQDVKFINTLAMHADSGKVKFYLNGTNMLLYATNDKSEITIDGKTYVINANDNNRNPSFIIDGLSNGEHLVEIDAKDMALDMIKTSGILSAESGANTNPDGAGPNWVGLGLSIAAGTAVIGVFTWLIVFTVKQKRKQA